MSIPTLDTRQSSAADPSCLECVPLVISLGHRAPLERRWESLRLRAVNDVFRQTTWQRRRFTFLLV